MTPALLPPLVKGGPGGVVVAAAQRMIQISLPSKPTAIRISLKKL